MTNANTENQEANEDSSQNDLRPARDTSFYRLPESPNTDPEEAFYKMARKKNLKLPSLSSIQIYWNHTLSILVVYEQMKVTHCTIKKRGRDEIHEQSKKWSSLWLSWLQKNQCTTQLTTECPPIFCVFRASFYFVCSYWTDFVLALYSASGCQDLGSGQQRLNRRPTSWMSDYDAIGTIHGSVVTLLNVIWKISTFSLVSFKGH